MDVFKECNEAVIVEEGRKKQPYFLRRHLFLTSLFHHYLFTDPFMIFDALHTAFSLESASVSKGSGFSFSFFFFFIHMYCTLSMNTKSLESEQNRLARELKGQCHEIFASGFFLGSLSPKPLIIPVGPFRIFSKIRGDFRSSRLSTTPVANGKNLPAEKF
jgi:hypothetical protein